MEGWRRGDIQCAEGTGLQGGRDVGVPVLRTATTLVAYLGGVKSGLSYGEDVLSLTLSPLPCGIYLSSLNPSHPVVGCWWLAHLSSGTYPEEQVEELFAAVELRSVELNHIRTRALPLFGPLVMLLFPLLPLKRSPFTGCKLST